MAELAEAPPKLGVGVHTLAGPGDEHSGPCHIVRVGDSTALCGMALKPGRTLHSRQACPRSGGNPCANVCAGCQALAGAA